MSIEAVTSVIQTYFDGFYEGDTAKLARAFHPGARLYSIDGESVRELSRAEWFDVVRQRESPKSAGLSRTDRILSVDVHGALASVKVELSMPPKYFVDRLTLLNVPGRGFEIVAKAFLTRFDERA